MAISRTMRPAIVESPRRCDRFYRDRYQCAAHPNMRAAGEGTGGRRHGSHKRSLISCRFLGTALHTKEVKWTQRPSRPQGHRTFETHTVSVRFYGFDPI